MSKLVYVSRGDDMNNDINLAVKKYRKQAKISQHKMAELLGMSYSDYSRLERNGIMKTQLVLDISYHLKIEPRKLLISGLIAEYEELKNKK